MFYRELRWEDAAKIWEKGEPLYEEWNTLPTLMENVEKAKITNVEGISFYAELEYLTAKNKGLTHFWKREEHCVESGEKPYGFLVERDNIWYSVIGKWKNEEDAKQELAAYRRIAGSRNFFLLLRIQTLQPHNMTGNHYKDGNITWN